jgi:Rnl2 family RNA ligase
MDFRKYQSIDNAYRTKTINAIMQGGYSEGEWVSTLKIHGANYAYYTDGSQVRRAKRSSFIENGENFMSDFKYDYTDNVLSMYNSLHVTQLSVHGEVYGGYYSHPDVKHIPSATRVQKGVSYTPYNDFIAFDIKIDGSYVSHDECIKLCTEFGIPHVPVLYKGTFKELLEKDTKFLDPLGEMLGFPKVKDNYAEGWVLKPVNPKFFVNGNRIILKGKNPDFSEKNGGKRGKPIKPILELTSEGKVYIDIIMQYINKNRLNNVLSHGIVQNITDKDFGKILGLFSKDVYNDFVKDNEEFNALDKKDQKLLKKRMNSECGNLIREHFLDIIDGEF